jgi:hypothetical protein
LSEDRLIKNEIGKLIKLCHPCIATSIGFAFGRGSRELKVLGISSESQSLFEVFRASPVWWTPTAKAVAGIVLGLRFTHSLGLVHGHFTTNSIAFDLNYGIQITGFLSGLSGNRICGFSNEGWNPETDIRGFVSILFEIAVGRPAKDEAHRPADLPMFVGEMTETGLSSESRRLTSFRKIFETQKQGDFAIVSGVDLADVLTFVDWIEELEQYREWQQLYHKSDG